MMSKNLQRTKQFKFLIQQVINNFYSHKIYRMIVNKKNKQSCEFSMLYSAFRPLNQYLTGSNAMNSQRDLRSWVIQEKQKIEENTNNSQSQNQCTKLKDDSLETNSTNSEPKFIQQQKISLQRSSQQLQELKQHTVSFEAQREKLNNTISQKTRLRNKMPLKYECQSDSENEGKEIKRCQTKNIIKNFIRSILSYLRKCQGFKIKVLKNELIDPQQFLAYLEKIQGKVNTISQLRELWTNGKYQRVFRLVSAHFLRKYYPKHIFHSRIFNYQIHLKYRIKLLKSLQNPQQFTSLKDY